MAEEKLFGVPVEETPLFGEPVDDGKQFYDDTYIGELGEGVVSGIIGIGEGLAGLGAAFVDVAADTNYGDQVTEAAEAARSWGRRLGCQRCEGSSCSQRFSQNSND
jgi:hypothetical protein